MGGAGKEGRGAGGGCGLKQKENREIETEGLEPEAGDSEAFPFGNLENFLNLRWTIQMIYAL